MLKKEKQQKYFMRVWGRMITHLNAFAKSKQPEHLHRLRVEMKKVMALLVFLEDEPKQKKLAKHFRPVKRIFKHAGKLRKAHLNLELMEKYKLENREFKKRQEEISAVEAAFVIDKKAAYAKIINKAGKKFSNELFSIKDKTAIRTYDREIKKLNRIFSGVQVPDNKLHRSRKKIKLLLYTHKIMPAGVTEKARLDAAYLKELQELIGKWHDIVSAMKVLQSNGFSNAEALTKLDTEKHDMLFLIRDLATDFVHRVYLPSPPAVKSKKT